MELTQEYLKTRLHYEPTTGVFTWLPCAERKKDWNTRHAGKAAGYTGTPGSNGYTKTKTNLDGKFYGLPRLAWLYMTGSWPVGEIDHLNHDPADNSWANLRDVDHLENMRNKAVHSNNTSGATGVSWIKRTKKWRASISTTDRKSIHGGYFDDFEEAVARRKELEAQYNFHQNPGAEKIAA
jgi:hypothetical protein